MSTKDNLPAEICFAEQAGDVFSLVVLHRQTESVRAVRCIRSFSDAVTAQREAVEINFLLGWNTVTLNEMIRKLTE